jgi:hypothetical protein
LHCAKCKTRERCDSCGAWRKSLVRVSHAAVEQIVALLDIFVALNLALCVTLFQQIERG